MSQDNRPQQQNQQQPQSKPAAPSSTKRYDGELIVNAGQTVSYTPVGGEHTWAKGGALLDGISEADAEGLLDCASPIVMKVPRRAG